MGKIADALNKYSKERKTVRVQKVTKADLDALMTYDRETGHLLKYDKESGRVNHNSMEVLRNRGTIQRLLDNKLIFPGGKLTPEGLGAVQRLEKRMQAPRPAATDDSNLVDFRVKNISLSPNEGEVEKEPPEFQETRTKEESRELRSAAQENPVPVGPMPPEVEPRIEQPQLEEEPLAQETVADGALGLDELPAEITPLDLIEIEAVEKRADSTPVHPTADHKHVEKSLPGENDRSTYSPVAIDKNLVSLLEPESYEAEQFKILRTNILYPLSGKPPRSILVTSALPAEGKSFVASNLAVSIALNIDQHVLLMDGDLRKPDLHSRFGFRKALGLSNYLSDGIPLTSLLLKTEVNKLTILPGGPPPRNPSELISSERMETLLKEVMDRYNDRLIVIDSPPPAMAAETAVLARQVDGIVLVVKHGKTHKDQIVDLIEKLGADKIIGSVINFMDLSTSKYYGYKKYGKYGKKYRK